MNHEISLHEPPSLFMIKTIFIETSKKNKKKKVEKNLETSDFEVMYILFQLDRKYYL